MLQPKALILGPEQSGKTTLLQRLVMKEVKDDQVSRTLGFNLEYFETMGETVGVIEMGGKDVVHLHNLMRQVQEFWEDMYSYVKIEVVMYVINFNSNLFSDSSFTSGDNTKVDADRKEVYRAFVEAKILMNEPALKEAFFFLVINVSFKITMRSSKTSRRKIELQAKTKLQWKA